MKSVGFIPSISRVEPRCSVLGKESSCYRRLSHRAGALVLTMTSFPQPPRRTVSRVFPVTALRRPYPISLSVTVVVDVQRLTKLG